VRPSFACSVALLFYFFEKLVALLFFRRFIVSFFLVVLALIETGIFFLSFFRAANSSVKHWKETISVHHCVASRLNLEKK